MVVVVVCLVILGGGWFLYRRHAAQAELQKAKGLSKPATVSEFPADLSQPAEKNPQPASSSATASSGNAAPTRATPTEKIAQQPPSPSRQTPARSSGTETRQGQLAIAQAAPGADSARVSTSHIDSGTVSRPLPSGFPQPPTEAYGATTTLAPSRMPTAPPTAAPSSGEIPVARSSPLRAQPPTRNGMLQWSGEADKDGTIVIEGNRSSVGTLSGELPGVPVLIDLNSKEFGVAEPPSPSNGWKRLVIRSRKKQRAAITINWTALP